MVAAAVPFTLGMEWLNAVKVAEQRRKAGEAEAKEKLESQVEPVNSLCSGPLGNDDGKEPKTPEGRKPGIETIRLVIPDTSS